MQRQQGTLDPFVDVSVDPASAFANTGIYNALAQQQQQEQQRRATQLQQQQNANLQQQQRRDFQQLLQTIQQPGRTARVSTPDVAEIDSFYNPITSDSIFATPEQSGMFDFINPYGRSPTQATGAGDVLGEIGRIMRRPG